ncbi:MAG: M50 family metallopeptidase [Armatimonadetes bacterium]|nr:M50 family metallopeptidase [Armatimonadota bacterium]
MSNDISLRRPQKLLLLAGAASAILWLTPGLAFLALPLVYLNTVIHEYCHALVALATGGDVLEVRLEASGNGITLSQGGSELLISSAGYVGAAVVAGLLLAASRKPKLCKSALLTLSVGVGLGLLLWVRGSAVGVMTAIGWTILLALGALRMGNDALRLSVQFLAIQQAMTSVLALYVLFRINVQPGIENDAANAEMLTGVPAILWALGWIALSGLALWVGLRAAWGSNRAGESPPEAR